MNVTRHLLAAAFVAASSIAFAATAHGQDAPTHQARRARSTTTSQVSGDAKLKAEAKIGEAEARATAMKQVPKGTIQSGELEREGGRLIYSFDIKVAGKRGIEEVNVDAMTGAVVAHEHESPAAEKREAAQEAKGRKTTRKP